MEKSIFVNSFNIKIMTPLENIENLFDSIKKGRLEAIDELFETIWLNHTNLPHMGVQPVLQKIFEWATLKAAEYPHFLAFTYLSKGTIAHHSDNFDEAMQCCNTAYNLFEEINDEDGMAAASIYIGFVYRSLGEIDLALKYGLEGIEQLSNSGKHTMLLLIGYYWVGGIYLETGQYDEAVQLFERGLQTNYKLGLETLEARFTNGLAGVYMKQKKYSLALENYLKALELTNEKEPTFKGRGLSDLGDYYFKMGDYDKAISYNMEALHFRREMNLQNSSITNLINLGEIYNKQGQFTEAFVILKDGLKLAEEIGVKSKMYQIHHLLSKLYMVQANWSESMGHYIAFHEIREDVIHEDAERKVKNQQKLFEAKQTLKENAIIKAQKAEIELKNHQLQLTIEELTITKISRRAKAITLIIGVLLIVIDSALHHFVVSKYAHGNYFILLASEALIVLLLKPIEKAVEHFLLGRIIKSKRAKEAVES